MKNTKVKIETSSEKLTKEEINSHKNFNNVYKTFTTTKTNVIKTPKKFGGLTTTVVVTTTVIVATVGFWKYSSHTKSTQQPQTTQSSSSTNSSSSSGSQNKTAVASTKPAAQHPYIKRPVKGVDVPYKTYVVDADKGAVFYHNGSKVIIPAGAFCDANGKDISGKVDIKYREFHNPADFFVSGIPMTYDSAGKQYTFESAGMLDMGGYQGGHPVYIKTGKDIKVEMVSTQTQTKYNMYYLDTNNQGWDYKSKSNYVTKPVADVKKNNTSSSDAAVIAKATPVEKQQIQQIQDTISTIKKAEIAIEKAKPVEPKKVTDGKNVFNIEADKSEFPELSVYKNMLFEADPNDKSYQSSWTSITWEDAKLKRNENDNTYTFTVKRGTESHSFKVIPVFEGKDYAAAKKEFDKKYADYQGAYNQRMADERKQQEAYDAMIAKIKQEQAEEEKRAIAANTAYAVTNYFTINQFGIWNSDNPGALPQGAELASSYTDNRNENLNGNDFYLVEKNRNALYIYHPGHNCRFNPDAVNYAWAVTPDNKIAIYTIDDFKKINKRSGDFTFDLQVVDKKIATMDDIKEIFKPYM